MKNIISRFLIILFGFCILVFEAKAQDPVPDFLKELQKYTGLETAVSGMVFNSPFGKIHGHDAERIELSADKDSSEVIIVFVMPESFNIHKDRILICKSIFKKWQCEEFKIRYVSDN